MSNAPQTLQDYAQLFQELYGFDAVVHSHEAQEILCGAGNNKPVFTTAESMLIPRNHEWTGTKTEIAARQEQFENVWKYYTSLTIALPQDADLQHYGKPIKVNPLFPIQQDGETMDLYLRSGGSEVSTHNGKFGEWIHRQENAHEQEHKDNPNAAPLFQYYRLIPGVEAALQFLIKAEAVNLRPIKNAQPEAIISMVEAMQQNGKTAQDDLDQRGLEFLIDLTGLGRV